MNFLGGSGVRPVRYGQLGWLVLDPQKVGLDGKVSKVASVSSATSVTIGKGEAGRSTLYVAGSDGTISTVKI